MASPIRQGVSRSRHRARRPPAGDRDGFVKLLFGEDDTLLGAHMVGQNVTEMIAEPTLARMLGATAHRIARTIHAHPTMNEGVMEAAEAALGEAIHL